MAYNEDIKVEAIRLRTVELLGLQALADKLCISKGIASKWLTDYPLSLEILAIKKKSRVPKKYPEYTSVAKETPSFTLSNPNHIGTLGELKVMFIAAAKGYTISTPKGHAQRYDFILDIENKLFRVQVKTVQSDGITVFLKSSSKTKKGLKYTNYTIKDIDCLVVYDITTDRCAWINASELGETGLSMTSFRYVPTHKNNKNIRLFSDYEWK